MPVPVGAFQDDRRNVSQSFDVVDRCRFAEQSDGDGKRRFLARPGFFAFDDLNDCGVLTSDIVMRRGNNLDF